MKKDIGFGWGGVVKNPIEIISLLHIMWLKEFGVEATLFVPLIF